MQTPLRLMIVDDHPPVRDGFAALLRDAGIDVVGMAGNGQEALDKAAEWMPDMVLMDINMPVMDGLVATRQFRLTQPQVLVVVLTMHDAPEYVAQAMQAGAAGYVLKDGSTDKLLRTLDAVRNGLFVFPPPSFSSPLLQPPSVAAVKIPLSARETEVLQLVAQGRQSGEIARLLGIETKTVETHRQKIRDKLGLRSVADLTRYALENGLV